MFNINQNIFSMILKSYVVANGALNALILDDITHFCSQLKPFVQCFYIAFRASDACCKLLLYDPVLSDNS